MSTATPITTCAKCARPFDEPAAEVAGSGPLCAPCSAEALATMLAAAPPPPPVFTPCRVVVDVVELRAALKLAKITTTKTHPAYEAARVVADGGVARIVSTDLEVSVDVAVGVDASSVGTTAVPVAALLDVAKGAKRGALTLDVVSHVQARAEVAGLVSHLSTLKVDELPEIPSDFGSEPLTFNVDARTFADALASVLPAAAVERYRFALNAVYLESSAVPGRLNVVATDGRRLHWRTVDCTVPAGFKVLVPLTMIEAAIEAWGTRKSGETRVDVVAGGNFVRAESPRVRIVGRVVEGSFPNWRDVIPGTARDAVTFAPPKEAVRILRQAQRSTTRDAQAVRLTISESGVHVRARSAEREFSAAIAAEGWTESFSTELGVNPQFLADALEAGGVRLRPGLRKNDPMLVAGDDGFTAVVMPVSLD